MHLWDNLACDRHPLWSTKSGGLELRQQKSTERLSCGFGGKGGDQIWIPESRADIWGLEGDHGQKEKQRCSWFWCYWHITSTPKLGNLK